MLVARKRAAMSHSCDYADGPQYRRHRARRAVGKNRRPGIIIENNLLCSGITCAPQAPFRGIFDVTGINSVACQRETRFLHGRTAKAMTSPHHSKRFLLRLASLNQQRKEEESKTSRAFYDEEFRLRRDF